jgi:hypothetical protein
MPELVVAQAAHPTRGLLQTAQSNGEIAFRARDVAAKRSGFAHRSSLFGQEQDHRLAQRDHVEPHRTRHVPRIQALTQPAGRDTTSPLRAGRVRP